SGTRTSDEPPPSPTNNHPSASGFATANSSLRASLSGPATGASPFVPGSRGMSCSARSIRDSPFEGDHGSAIASVPGYEELGSRRSEFQGFWRDHSERREVHLRDRLEHFVRARKTHQVQERVDEPE